MNIFYENLEKNNIKFETNNINVIIYENNKEIDYFIVPFEG